MKIGSPKITFVYHLGAHATDEERLIRSLLMDEHALAERKILVPRPRTYRSRLGKVMAKYRGNPIPDDEQKALFDKIVRGIPTERVIFSHDDFLCLPRGVFAHKWLYSRTSYRSKWSRNLFPENPAEFFLAIRNPSTYLQAMLNTGKAADYQKFTKGVDPRTMLWSQMIEALRDNNPGCPITVWCNEDTPLIWPTILREIADVDLFTPMAGELNMLKSIMEEEGFARMQTYLASHKIHTEVQRRRVFEVFLDKFAKSDALEEEIDLPGWTPELVDEVTAIYEDDVLNIERMSGVNLITT